MPQPRKIFYKGQEFDFVVFTEDSETLAKYRKGDSTIPLIDVVSIFKVFINRQKGLEGILDEASKQEIQSEFGLDATAATAIERIVKEGADKANANVHKGYSGTNDADGAQAGHTH